MLTLVPNRPPVKMSDLAKAAGKQVKGRGDELMCQCPNTAAHKHGDKVPSCSINDAKGAAYCHACGESWGYVSFARALGVALPERRQDAAHAAPPAVVERTPRYTAGFIRRAYGESIFSDLSRQALGYLEGRRLSSHGAYPTPSACNSNAQFPISVPLCSFPKMELVGIHARSVVGKKDFRTWIADEAHGTAKVIGEPGSKLSGTLIVAEGITDYLTARQLWPQHTVIGLAGASASIDDIAKSIGQLPQDVEVWIAVDTDSKGEKANAAIRRERPKARRVLFDAADLNEAHCLGRDISISGDQTEDFNDLRFSPSDLSAMKRRQGLPPYRTGIVELDAALGGGLPAGGITLFPAPPGSFKTAFAIQNALVCAQDNIPVIYLSHEMPRGDLLACFCSHMLRLPRIGCVRGDYETAMEDTVAKLSGMPISVLRGPTAALESLPAFVSSVARHHGVPPLIIDDYLQFSITDVDDSNIRHAVGARSSALMAVATEFLCPVLALSATSREKYGSLLNREGKVEFDRVLAMGKESGKLEADSYCVFSVVRVPSEHSSDLKRAYIAIAKSRFGPKDIAVPVEIDAVSGSFRDTDFPPPVIKGFV